MLVFDELTLGGFRSFSGISQLSFNRPPGLYLLSGENQVDQDLGSNGAGKSTVWDALCWVLYGRTSRGLKGPSLKSWYDHAGRTGVDLTFRTRHHSYHLMRTHAPNYLGWSIDSGEFTEATQDQLDEALGMSWDVFLHSILVSQFHPLFFDLGPSDKVQLFSSILTLDRWLDYSDQAKEKAAKYKAKASEYSFSIAAQKSILEKLQLDHIELQKRQEIWDDGLDKRIKSDEFAVQLERDALETTLRNLESTEHDLSEIQKHIDLKKNRCDDLQNESKETRSAVSSGGEQKALAHSVMVKAKAELESAQGLSDNCVKCSQVVPPEHKAAVLVERQEAVVMAESRYKDAEANMSAVQFKVNGIHATLDCVRSELEDQQAKQSDLRVSKQKFTTQIDGLKKGIDHGAKELEKCRVETNPYTSLAQQGEEEIAQTQAKLNADQAGFDEAQALEQSTRYWIDGFRSLRLNLLNSGVTQFEAELQSAMSACGLSQWLAKCLVDPDSVGRASKKGFQVLLTPPNKEGDQALPWETWSGGEGQLLRLCGTFALSNLIAARCGVQSNIEVYDEPSKAISEEGVQGLLERLAERARTQNKVIFVSDHRAMDARYFDGIVCAVKTADGTTLQ